MAVSVPPLPPYGKRLIPHVVDEIARSKPDRLYASFPRSPNLADGFHIVTFRGLAKAANAAAWWLEEKVGRSDDTETLAYMSLSDILYAIMFLASVKCGYKVSSDLSLYFV